MNHRSLILLLTAIGTVSGCSQITTILEDSDGELTPLVSPFDDKQGCYLLYDVKNQKLVRALGGKENCERRLTACSTFKVPAALMGFDSGVLKDENTKYKWDGRKWPIEAWNQDLTAAEWMKVSSVWYTQRVTPKIGLEKMKRYLKDFKYGNQDLSSGILTSWLTVAPFMKEGSKGSLKISAHEQLEFMKRLWAGDLKVSKRAIDLTKKITFIEKSPQGFEFSGKTGSGFTNEDQTGRIGWFISHLQKGDQEFVAVLSYTDTVPKGSSGYAGLEAREMTKALLKQEGLW